MADATGQVKKSWDVVKAHWLLITIIVVIVVGVALAYDMANDGKLTEKYAGLPGVGDRFKKKAAA